MPKLELGDLDAVAALKEMNIPPLAKLAREGYAILTAIPSCTLMFKQELPLMFPEDADVQAVREAMFDPFEYLVRATRTGCLKTDFKQPLGQGVVSHSLPLPRAERRPQDRGDAEAVSRTPTVNTVERCSGHSGTWGVKKEFHAIAMKIGRPVFSAMAETEPDYISSDCQLAGHHIEQGIGEQARATRQRSEEARLAHPLTLVRIAYGLY